MMTEKELAYERQIPIKGNEALRLKAFEYCEGYKDFIDNAKTEREAVEYTKNIAESNGFLPLSACSVSSGEKLYYVNNCKSVFYARIGSGSLENGVRLIVAHVDSPRLDLKQLPLFESSGISYFKTHYYGGLKKYQWTALPLSLHGVIYKADGEKIDICIGEDDDDPVFYITDLMPHIAKDQYDKTLRDAIPGETLNIVNGSVPFDDEKGSVKHNILCLLNEKYGITERDFITAELSATPAQRSRDVGFDRSMIAAYGQDDRICAYPAFTALLDSDDSDKTRIVVFADKEEIGSIGNTGMESHMFDFFISEILNKLGVNRPNLLDKVFCFSKMLSSDVDAGFDPIYSSVSDKANAGFLGKGISLNKYTGARGKSGASDANAEYVAWVRNVLEKNEIKYQIAELGKVDIGGGGTIAYILANKGTDVIDCGVPVLSMHAPYEVTSKYDIYSAYKTYKAFWQE